MSGALAGLRVIDCSRLIAGGVLATILADHGADVIKVENPRGGDPLRTWLRDRGELWWKVYARGKRSVTLNLTQARGQALLRRLCGDADVLIENYVPGTFEKWGLGWSVLSAENPRLVFGTGKGFGLSGPYRDLPAMDLTIQAMSGIMNATGFPDLPPVKAGPAVCDFLAAVHLFGGIMSALLHRERTGEGQLVEVSMHEAAVVALASALGAFMDGDGGVPERTGNRHPALAIAPYNVYPTRDGFVAIFTASERHWHSIARVLGREDLLDNPDYASTPSRAAHMEEIDALVEAWTRGRGKDEVMAELTLAHVPCAPVRTTAEVVHDPHLKARGHWTEVDHPRRGKTLVPNSPIRLHGSAPGGVERPAPLLGQDTDRVLAELLGLGSEELAALHARGVIEPVTGGSAPRGELS